MARIPFTLDRKSSQTQQMVDGVMSAIAARHWKPGDTLPTAAEFGKALGTGGYVPRTALRQLADEGVVILKKHVGAVVARQKPTVKCLGRIAFISCGRRESYYENVHAFALQDIFEQAGWDLVHIMTPRADNSKSCKPDLSSLQRQLKQGIDFAICFTESREVASELDKSHVRYVYEGGSGREFPNAIATINLEAELGFYLCERMLHHFSVCIQQVAYTVVESAPSHAIVASLLVAQLIEWQKSESAILVRCVEQRFSLPIRHCHHHPFLSNMQRISANQIRQLLRCGTEPSQQREHLGLRQST